MTKDGVQLLMPIILINPNLVVQSNDPLTTGVVYMPIALAYAGASLRAAGHDIKVIDAYAQNPRKVRKESKFWIFGLTPQEVVEEIPKDSRVVVIYAINLTNHLSTIAILKHVRQVFPSITIIILENTQAVTAYALKQVASEFYNEKADYILTGEAESRISLLVEALKKNDLKAIASMEGVGNKDFYNPPVSVIENLDALSLPAWDLFPLENYWSLGFAHGPLSSERYLPLLTSRGCPYPCRFCVVPATNNQRWRSRTAMNVVDEMEHWVKCWNVKEFHIEDLDPTISDDRIREICHEIIRRQLKIIWKIAAGTKVETIRNEETIVLMAQAGCRYISISPETGSARILKLMKKPFNLDHSIKLIKCMNKNNIRSQACFVLGFPGETHEDRRMTLRLVRNLTRQGVDEIALFIITPVPGSSIAEEFSGYQSLSELNFTPSWRKDYKVLVRFRMKVYIYFICWKSIFHSFKIARQISNFMRRRFETKMEMVPYRAFMLRHWASKV